MKKTGRTFLSLFLLLCCVLFAQGQAPVVFSPDITVTAYRESIIVPIQTRNFHNLTGLQFLLSWDSSKLKYKKEITCAPNPFSKTTRVDLSMKETTTALISIIDISGKKIHEERRHFDKGEHTILLDSRMFPARGTYFYRVQAPQFTVTQKMIFL
jgi:hypothetical protein